MDKGQVFMTAMVTALILLSVLLYYGVMAGKDTAKEGWSLGLDTKDGTYFRSQNIYAGSDQTCYVFGARDIYAIGKDGMLKWEFAPNFTVTGVSGIMDINVMSATDKDGWLYVIMAPSLVKSPVDIPQIMAIGPDGKPSWSQSFDEPVGSASLAIVGDRIFVQSSGIVGYGGTLKVIDLGGHMIWKNCDADASAIGADGSAYVLAGMDLKCYSPDGSLQWSTMVPITINPGDPGWSRMLACRNGTIYVGRPDGIAAFEENGSIRWAKTYDKNSRLFEGLDAEDRIYLDHINSSSGINIGSSSGYTSYTIISPDGTETEAAIPNLLADNSHSTMSMSDGTAYYVLEKPADRSLSGGLDSYTVVAYSVASGRQLWSYDTCLSSIYNTTLNESSVGKVLYYWDVDEAISDNRLTPQALYQSKGMAPGSTDVRNYSMPRCIAGSDVIYVSYWSYKYEYPLFFNSSPCLYAGGIYAFDRNGNLLWDRSVDSYVTSMDARNGTIYYQTNDGKVSSIGAGMAAGIIAAAAYLFLRFFGMGTIGRAKARLDKNEKRIRIRQFIEDRPGSTLYEIARGTGVNVGTARYHLLILTINHKIAAYDDGTKFVRYFRNANAYSEDKKLIIGLCRRETIRRVLGTVVSDSNGLTNTDIADTLGLQESAVSRSLRELVRAGIVQKMPGNKDRPAYSIEDRYVQVVASVLRDLDAELPGKYQQTDTHAAYEV